MPGRTKFVVLEASPLSSAQMTKYNADAVLHGSSGGGEQAVPLRSLK
jgi:hypothetical protein